MYCRTSSSVIAVVERIGADSSGVQTQEQLGVCVVEHLARRVRARQREGLGEGLERLFLLDSLAQQDPVLVREGLQDLEIDLEPLVRDRSAPRCLAVFGSVIGTVLGLINRVIGRKKQPTALRIHLAFLVASVALVGMLYAFYQIGLLGTWARSSELGRISVSSLSE